MEHLSPLVLRNRQIADRYFQIDFEWPGEQTPIAGQFVTLRVAQVDRPLLRRPFAFAGFDPEARAASIIYELRGSATQILSTRQPGDRLDLIGALGNSFPIPDTGSRPLLLAGGIGMGPMFFFAEQLARSGKDPILVLGARTAGLIPKLAIFDQVESLIATDDGSMGYHGNLLQAILEKGILPPHGQVEVYACGPFRMMQAAQDLAIDRGFRLWVSMEQTMGCAVGACMACVVRVTDRALGNGVYARVCTEGPVFRAESIDWENPHV